MKNILVPTDFSENAWNALEYSLHLFRDETCKFHLFHINPMVAYSGAETTVLAGQKELVASMNASSKKQLKKWLDKIETLQLKTTHEYEVNAVYHFFIDAIREEIDAKNIDLVVMGTKGARGLKKVTIGSNTTNVLTKIRCPLLSVPENATFEAPKEIAFPTDYQLNYDLKVLEWLVHIVKLHKAALRVLYISKRGEKLSEEQLKNKEFLEDFFDGLEFSFHNVTGGRLDTAVQCFVESREIDLLAMVAKNLNFLQRILFRPKVEEISYHTDVPFLILHE